VPQTQGQGGAPVISAPLRGVRYSQRSGKPVPINLRAEAAAGVKSLYWFVGDSLIGKAKPGETLTWQPASPGSYLLRVVDDQGQAESREVVVELVP
jgi:penicillin-binding protein 1C